MIGIIDYHMGNLRSVEKALEHVGGRACILRSPDDAVAHEVSKLILPGVGAFGDGMSQLREARWDSLIVDWIARDQPFLGVCLGMQLLFAGSEEDAPSPDAPVPGLGVLPGVVRRFQQPGEGRPRIKIPHMGWNTLRFTRPDNPLFAGLDDGAAVYFVHSYHCAPASDIPAAADLVAATSDYPGPFCAAVWRDRLWATQFHPEKSQRVGLTMLTNFVKL